MNSISLEIQQKIFENWLASYNCKEILWRIGNTKSTGRGLIATRDIKVNELILCEPALIIGTVGNEKEDILCVTCFKFISKDEICGTCGLPICFNCPKMHSHFDECKFFKSFSLSKRNEITSNHLRVLTSVRGVLLDNNKKYILKLLQANITTYDEKLIDNIFKDLRGRNEKLRYELILVTSILNTNAFQIAVNSVNNQAKNLRGLYPLMSLINHRCTANDRYSTDENYTKSVFARKQIKMGEEISISYSKLLWSTPARQNYLKVTKEFTCRCDRCLDPTERSTFLSVFKCFDRSCLGLVLPVDPISFSSLWKCSMCQQLSEYKTILHFQEVVSCMINGCSKMKSITDIDNVINNRLLKVLPVSNQFVVEMKMKIISMMGKDYSSDDYAIIERYCMDILLLLEKLDAGECIAKGIIEFKLFQCRQLAGNIKFSRAEFEEDQRTLLANAWSILKDNISAPFDLCDEIKKYVLCNNGNLDK